MQLFRTSLDTLSKGITSAVVLLFFFMLYHRLNEIGAYTFNKPDWTTIFIVTLFVGILSVGYLFHPRKYSLANGTLIIHRPVSNITIKLDDIKSAERVTREDMRWTARTFGNGGLFGYYGKFWNKKFGSMTWYATRRENFVLITLQDGSKIVLTPDDIALTDVLTKQLH